MRVLSFSYCFPNQTAPAWGMFVQNRLAAMSGRADVKIVSPCPWFPGTSGRRGDPGPETDERDGLKIYRPRFICVPKVLKNSDAWFYSFSIRRWLDQFIDAWNPDIFDAHFIWPDGVGVANLARHYKRPYSITLRGKLYPCLEIAAQARQCSRALLDADQVISVDSRMAEVAESLGVSPQRIAVIPNGVDVDRFSVGDRDAARRSLGLPADKRLIVTVAHLGKRKGHHETIKALRELPADVLLVLVGGASDSGEDGTQLRVLAEQYGVSDRLIIAGKQPYDVVPMFYRAANLTVLASWREGCPNMVLESLACGTPVVATDVGAVRSMIDDGNNGRIVALQDAAQLASAMRSMLDHPPETQSVCRSAAVRSWGEVADDVLSVFQQALVRSAGRNA